MAFFDPYPYPLSLCNEFLEALTSNRSESSARPLEFSCPILQPHPLIRLRRTSDIAPTSSEGNANKFQLYLNVKHYKLEELSVKVVDNFIVVHGKHEESPDEHGYVAREFTRRYEIPEDVDRMKITPIYGQDGILTIEALRKIPKPPKNEMVLPIVHQRPAVRRQPEQQEAQVDVHNEPE